MFLSAFLFFPFFNCFFPVFFGTAQNLALFQSPATFFFLRGFLVVFWKVRALKCAALGPPGLHTTARELETCTFQGQGASKHHQNSTRRHQKSEEKMKIVAGEGKSAKLWASHPSGSTLRVFVLPCFVFSSCCSCLLKKKSQKTETPIWPKLVWPKVGFS